MRVLFTTTPGRGHYFPMLPLAAALRDAGHDVLWVAAAPVCERLREDGWDARPAGLAEGETWTDLERHNSELAALPPEDRPDFVFQHIFGRRRAEPMLRALLPVAREWAPELLVCDQAEFAGPLLAALLDAPNVTFAFGHPLPERRVRRAGESLAALWEEHGLTPRPYGGAYEHLYLDIYPRCLHAWDSGHIAARQPIGPGTAGPVGEAPVWLQTERTAPLVYVTFGTVWNKDLSLITRVVEGVASLPVEVLVTIGPGADPAALGPQPANVRVETFVPQVHVLEHAALVVSHGGSGTFLAAVAAGLPQLLLPQAADQFLNARAARHAGVGLDLRDTSPPAVREAAARALADVEMRAAARRAADEIAAMPSPAEVAALLARRY